VISSILVVIGIIFITLSAIDLANGLKDLGYEETQGKITQYERITTVSRTGRHETIQITYEYSVNGILHVSSKFSNGHGNRNDFESFYKNNIAIPVFYNPENSDSAVLVRGGRYLKVDGSMIIGILLMLWGIIGIGSRTNTRLEKIWQSISE